MQDELEAAQDPSSTSSQVGASQPFVYLFVLLVLYLLAGALSRQSEDNILESKIRLLESQLKQKSMEAEHMASSMLGAQETLENAREVRELNEQIMQLQSTERKLKAEVRMYCC